MDVKLAGKIALVSGSGRGIGLVTARAFATKDCRLLLSARSAEQPAGAASDLRATGAELAALIGGAVFGDRIDFGVAVDMETAARTI